MEFAKKQREAMGLDKDPTQDDGMTTADETTRVKKDSNNGAGLTRQPTAAVINSFKKDSSAPIIFSPETPRNLEKSPSAMPVLASVKVNSSPIVQKPDMDADERKIQELRKIKHEQEAVKLNSLSVPAKQDVRGSIQSSQADAWGHHGGQGNKPVGPQRFDVDSEKEDEPENDDLRRSIPGEVNFVKPAQATVKTMEYEHLKSSPRNVLAPDLRQSGSN